jgi:hypothetical protein
MSSRATGWGFQKRLEDEEGELAVFVPGIIERKLKFLSICLVMSYSTMSEPSCFPKPVVPMIKPELLIP